MVLIGDPNQLPAVGPGQVMQDLLELDFPYVKLTKSYRIEDEMSGLGKAVCCFDSLHSVNDLCFDDSLQLKNSAG